MIETHPHCQPPKCRLHEKSLAHCTTCKRVGRPECTLIPERKSCPKCEAQKEEWFNFGIEYEESYK